MLFVWYFIHKSISPLLHSCTCTNCTFHILVQNIYRYSCESIHEVIWLLGHRLSSFYSLVLKYSLVCVIYGYSLENKFLCFSSILFVSPFGKLHKISAVFFFNSVWHCTNTHTRGRTHAGAHTKVKLHYKTVHFAWLTIRYVCLHVPVLILIILFEWAWVQLGHPNLNTFYMFCGYRSVCSYAYEGVIL